jgi:ankyrin repeat protein
MRPSGDRLAASTCSFASATTSTRRDGHAALHEAAYAGDRELCELLLGLGADPTLRDTSFDATPAGWARHSHHDELAAWLEERTGSAE